jgi:hypothetical protein
MKEYFDTICPHPKVLDRNIVRATLPKEYSAKTVMEGWLKLLKETPEGCVEIDDKIFDIWYAGDSTPFDYEAQSVQGIRL